MESVDDQPMLIAEVGIGVSMGGVNVPIEPVQLNRLPAANGNHAFQLLIES